jgi:hypothetical protein
VDNLLFNPTDCNFNSDKKREALKVLEYFGSSLEPTNLFTKDIIRKKRRRTGTSIYHTNAALRSIVAAASQSADNRKLRLASLGGQLMAADRRRQAVHRYRYAQEGLQYHVAADQLIQQHYVAADQLMQQHHVVADQLIQQRHVVLSQNEMRQLLAAPRNDNSQQQPPMQLSQLSQTARNALNAMGYGQCIVTCQLDDDCVIHLVAFASMNKIQLDVNEDIRNYYRFLLRENESSEFSSSKSL